MKIFIKKDLKIKNYPYLVNIKNKRYKDKKYF